MDTVEERVAFLEATAGEHTRMTDGIRDAIRGLDERLDRRLTGLEEKFDRRTTALEEKVDRRVTRLEEKIDLRTDAIDTRMSRQFLWLVGLHVTTLVTMVGALSGIIAAILGR